MALTVYLTTIKHVGDCDVNDQYYVTNDGITIKGRYRHPMNHSAEGKERVKSFDIARLELYVTS